MMPYSMMVANGVLWFTYGALASNPTIMLPNITAIAMGSGYCTAFMRYRSPQAVRIPLQHRPSCVIITEPLACELLANPARARSLASQASVLAPMGVSAAITASVIGAATSLPVVDAQNFIGYLGCAVCAGMFAGPLASMQAVLRDRSAAAIPLGFTLFSTVNTSAWLAYGKSHPSILLASSCQQNSTGLVQRYGKVLTAGTRNTVSRTRRLRRTRDG